MTVLATPFVLRCGLVLANRLVKSAMAEGLATAHGLPTTRHQRLYETWARGGAGLLVTGNVMIDPDHRSASGDVVLREDAHGTFAAWSAAVTRHGAPLFMQLNHPGRQAPRRLCARPIAPSAVAMERASWLFAAPRALSVSEIEALIDRFARAAAFAERTGFAGVEVHAAHGYLLSQFLSPKVNVRRDVYGGSAENRLRILVEVIRKIRKATSKRFAVAVKLNSSDLERGGLDIDDSLTIARRLDDEGIDLLEVTAGTYASDALLGRATGGRTPYFVEYVRALRAVCGVPLVLTGGHRDADCMAELVSSGVHDLVGLARPMVLVPDLPRRVFAGERVRITEPEIVRIPGVVSLLALRWYTQQMHRIADGTAAIAESRAVS